MNITNQTSTLLDMLNSSSSSSKTSKSDSYVDILIQNNNLRYQQRMKEVLGTNVVSSSKDAEYEKTAGAAANLNKSIEALSDTSIWNTDSKDYSSDSTYDAIANFVSSYNTLLSKTDSVGSTIKNTYGTKLNDLTDKNKEALEAIGITVESDGKLKIDSDKLKQADISEVKKIFGSDSEFIKGVKEQSEEVNNIVSRALSIQKSLSSLYNSSSSSVDVSELLYGSSYDSIG